MYFQRPLKHIDFLLKEFLPMKNNLDIPQLLNKLRSQFQSLQHNYQVVSLEIFGSYVRKEQSSASDLDILVTFSEVPSLLKFITLENELSDFLGIQVDLVMKDSLKPALEETILNEAISI